MRVVDQSADRAVAVHRQQDRTIWVMHSIAFGSVTMAGDVIVTGSHGGRSAGEYAASYGVAVVACNDAGKGKNDAGVAGLAALEPLGIAGVAVGHYSARIGDGVDAWDNGYITYVNAPAAELGITVGARLQDELIRIVDSGGI